MDVRSLGHPAEQGVDLAGMMPCYFGADVLHARVTHGRVDGCIKEQVHGLETAGLSDRLVLPPLRTCRHPFCLLCHGSSVTPLDPWMCRCHPAHTRTRLLFSEPPTEAGGWVWALTRAAVWLCLWLLVLC